MANKRITAYARIGDGTAQDAHLRVEVTLTLADTPQPKKVAYIVGTGPNIQRVPGLRLSLGADHHSDAGFSPSSIPHYEMNQ